MADKQKIAKPIETIMKSQLGAVLSQAFAQLYRSKPNFPVTYLAEWLLQYSHNNKKKKQKSDKVAHSIKQHNKVQEQAARKQVQKQHSHDRQQLQKILRQKQFNDTITGTQHLQDLLLKWLPNYIEKQYHLSGAYVGKLIHPYKPVQPTNFEPGAQIDSQSPKIIQYLGTSDSQQKLMHMKILQNQKGVTFECFNQPEPQPQQPEPAEGQQPKPPKQPKKTYIYVPDVTKNEKIHYFKFPRLGSYACFPLKLKNVLLQSGFDQSVADYKQFVKQKQEIQKQYNDKHLQLKNQYEQAKKKYDQFQVPQQQPTAQQVAEKKALQEQANKFHANLQQFQKSPPKITDPKFTHNEKCYVLGIDTLGQDQKITQQALDQIDKKIGYFKKQFETKQKQMLLRDILAFIEDEPKNQTIQNLYRQHEKNAQALADEQAKQKNIKDKQLEYQTAVVKTKKMDSLFQDANIERSMKVYFNYNSPKFKQILQIGLMLLGYKAKDINIPRTNYLDFRKVSQPAFIQQFLKKLQQFDLRPVQAVACPQEYKINKLLQRLQKVDLQQVSKYNGFIWALANHLKSYCWALILCRDAKKQAYELSIKNKQNRNNQIQKYKQQRSKAMDTAKAELGQQNQASFNEQQWVTNYSTQNPQPQALQSIKLQQYLNID